MENYTARLRRESKMRNRKASGDCSTGGAMRQVGVFLKNPLLAALALLGTCAAAFSQNYKGQELVQPSLVADTTAVAPGRPFTVGLVLKMAPRWHTYWQFPGDSGIATSIGWKLPAGFKAGAIQWPLPRKEIDRAGFWTHVYDDETMLLVEIVPPQKIDAKEISITGHADWLVCESGEEGLCIPGRGDVSLTLPVADTGAPANAELFAKYRALLPQTGKPPFGFAWSSQPDRAVLDIAGADARKPDFFPLPASGLSIGHAQVVGEKNGAHKITVPVSGGAPGALAGLVVLGDGVARESWLIPSASSAPATPARGTTALNSRPSTLNLLRNLLFGFLGGLILNLMPCVLPAITLKIFGFVKQAGESPERIFRLGLAFCAGIFAWFLALAALIVGFKMAGRELTWAFQFQNSYFLIGMCSVVLVFALNLFGVFEIMLPTAAGDRALDLAQREGYGGAFFHGVFATLLATPCTAPFLGSALGFALGQSPPVIFVMFAAIAAGMSLPYVLLTARPAWMKYLPKPGMWMERLKQFMGFLLMATVLWLLWVVGRQRGVDGMLWAGAFLLVLGVACWIKGAFIAFTTSPAVHRAATVVIVVIVALGGWYFIGKKFAHAQREEAAMREPFGKTLEHALAQNRAVFVDFTADWCVNCKVNEKLVLNTAPVQEALKRDGVIFLKADWTNGDAEITALLKKYGKAGVPAYVLFPAGKPDAPIVLPETLTQKIVIDALAEAKK